MVTQVAPESHTLHQWSVWSGSAGICLIERGSFSLLIIMIGRGDGWTGTSSIEMSLQIQFMDNKSNGHRYFSMRIQERRIQYVCRGKIVIVRVVQGQLLPRSACLDEDALFSIQDDHSMCLDTSIWDPGTDDSSRLSA